MNELDRNKTFVDYYKIFKEIVSYVRNYPKEYRDTLGSQIIKEGLNILTTIKLIDNKNVSILEATKISIQNLSILLRFSVDLKCVSIKCYSVVVEKLNKVRLFIRSKES